MLAMNFRSILSLHEMFQKNWSFPFYISFFFKIKIKYFPGMSKNVEVKMFDYLNKHKKHVISIDI